ncbi:FAD-dependent oxidoreductase [Pseudomonas fluorescens]|uniref:Urocanate reductase n=1 Tax=Pseudomonas fluorescens TaxID=294 RepID=A0A5E7E0U3_PSEFL|nr:FAD-dependent oxidoreductase [Pseudomonas fluorescens]VVO21288.1 Urocanate reductase [Pseudomonas fluorescens]
MKLSEHTGQWDHQADVVIVGYGIAGACAALEATRAGAGVLVLERASGGGGASATSSGIFYLGGGTQVQQACGYEDDADEMYKFLSASTECEDKRAVRDFCDGSVEHFDWLESLGVPFERTSFKGKAVFLNTTECLFSTGNEKVWPYNVIARPAPRGHKVAGIGENAGAEAMKAILARCEDEGVPALNDCAVRELIQDDDGRVVGVIARHDGRQVSVRARKGVVIASGGFNLNHEMVQRNVPLMSETAMPLGIPSNDGAGIELGLGAGAATLAMGGIIATASIYPPGQLIKGILVNRNGERFVAEDSYHGRTASYVMEQPDQTAYLILDAEIFAYPEITSAQHALIDGWDSVEEMEVGLNLPKGALVSTVEQYNSDAQAGEDRLFHKHPDWLKPLDQGPFAAFDISFNKSIYLFMTLGGLQTNRHAQVINTHGRVIPGLYAAGACSAHIPQSGKTYASGMSLGPGSFFGRVAGRHASQGQLPDL